MRALLFTLFLVGCGSDNSTPDAPPEPGAINVTAGGDVLSYTGFRWGANNDCPASGAGVISVTIRGPETGAGDHGLGLCLPRPDQVGTASLDLGDTTHVQLAGITGKAGSCEVAMKSGAVGSGFVTFTGFSTQTGAGYQMTFAGQVAGTSSCGDGPITLFIAGTAAVTAQ